MEASLGSMRSPGIPRSAGFTLVELLVAMSVMAVLLAIVSQIVGSAATLTGLSSAHQEADIRARNFFSRMDIDFREMLRRKDVDYYLKDTARPQPGNDRMAFYSDVPGYYPPSNEPGPLSLVAYRVGNVPEGLNGVERMGKGLSWHGGAAGEHPIVFLPQTIAATWPAVTDDRPDSNYEEMGRGIFRFEYYYVLRSGMLSAVPWDANEGHDAIDGLTDVSAVVVVIAVVDSAAGLHITNNQLEALAQSMRDFDSSMQMGDIEKYWQDAVASGGLPPLVAKTIRIYRRTFLLNAWQS